MEHMKNILVFLDIDGVLNNESFLLKSGGAEAFDPDNVKLLNKLIKETNASVVISSAWRIGHSL